MSLKDKVILIDGPTAVGKSTLCLFQDEYSYSPEITYEKYDYNTIYVQYDNILRNINRTNFKTNCIIDTSFLMNLSNLFFSDDISKVIKLEALDYLINNTDDYIYVSDIVYLHSEFNELLFKKENDNNRARNSFLKNTSYLDKELNFYTILNKYTSVCFNFEILILKTTRFDLTKDIWTKVTKHESGNTIYICSLLKLIYKLVEEDIL